MSQDAQVRVRLDTSGARADLQALYGDFRRAPAVSLPGGGAGVGGGGFGGGGGFNLPSILGSLAAIAPGAMLGAPIARDAFGVANGILGGFGQAASGALGIAGLAGSTSGRQRAADETAALLGIARGFGGASKEEAKSLYESLSSIYEPEARGKAEIRAELGGEVAKDGLSDLGDKLAQAIRDLGEMIGVRP